MRVRWAARSAFANLEILGRESMAANAAAVGGHLLAGLKDRLGEHPFIGDIRGEGLMIGVEFTADRATRRPFKADAVPHRLVAAKALEHGLMVRGLPFIEVISFSPPLCITKAECEQAVDRFAAAVDAMTPELTRLARD
ncbi:MAG: aminotransferase class III-fold pyridoxal phosphate-dependent enzyme [Geminicoccaceae bacterium]